MVESATLVRQYKKLAAQQKELKYKPQAYIWVVCLCMSGNTFLARHKYAVIYWYICFVYFRIVAPRVVMLKPKQGFSHVLLMGLYN